MIARRPRTLAFDSMERRDLMAAIPVINVNPGGLVDIVVRNNNVQVDILRNADVLRNAIVVVDVL